MRIQYGDRCMSRTQVYEWTEKFKNIVTSVEDSPRPGPAFTAVTDENIAAVARHRESTVTSATYSKLLRENLKSAIRQKRRGLLTMGVSPLHDNPRPPAAAATVWTIRELRYECIPHPSYSPNLVPSDFHVFGPLKDALSETQFQDDEVRSAVHEWLRTRPK
jgi:hypothetical protein